MEGIDQRNAARKLSPSREWNGEEGYEADRCDLIYFNLCFYLVRAYRVWTAPQIYQLKTGMSWRRCSNLEDVSTTAIVIARDFA